jgi:hypothetical protein
MLFTEFNNEKDKNSEDGNSFSHTMINLLPSCVENNQVKEKENNVLPERKNVVDEKAIKIQRKWRKFKIKKYMNVDSSKKIENELKKSIINSFSCNENFKIVISMMNSSFALFSSLMKNNKSILNLIVCRF